jgi:hypothetical protein|tara:strand:- start:2808 stop:3263 length:456 start_codon:yes stop_codon:yes gene_type:complete
MILIAHRGNLIGPKPEMENNPFYIDTAIKQGYDVEIDIRGSFQDGFYLGHDEPQYQVEPDWLFERAEKLWIHAKSIEAFYSLTQQVTAFNVFWHQEDYYTLTTRNFIWAYPGHTLTNRTICVMPESVEIEYPLEILQQCAGICTDYVERYK